MFLKMWKKCWKHFDPKTVLPTLYLIVWLCGCCSAGHWPIESLLCSRNERKFMNKELGILKVKTTHRNEPKKTFIFHFAKSVTHSESNNSQQSVLKAFKAFKAFKAYFHKSGTILRFCALHTFMNLHKNDRKLMFMYFLALLKVSKSEFPFLYDF